MLLTFHCEHCDARLRIDADASGTSLDCPECDEEIVVPNLPFGPGYVIGGFLIKEKIGQGGMGEVYLAKQLSMERNVALKILPPQFTRQGNFVVRFLKEVHFQAKLDHPNIVTAYEAGEDRGVYYMAMAYVRGETLEDVLDRDGALDEQDALNVTLQIAEALQYAWDEHGLLHRDIKPGNIMLNNQFKAMILDMGLSKSIHDTRATTQANTLMGTPNYMSPEQIDAPQTVDFRSDMYALGMTLYHMLTGVIPFQDSTFMQTLKRHGEEQLTDPRELMPGIHGPTVLLLERMLARDPGERPDSWERLLHMIRLAKVQRRSTLPDMESPSTLQRSATADAAEQGSIGNGKLSGLSPRVVYGVTTGLVLGIVCLFLINRAVNPPAREVAVLPTATPPALPTATPTPPPLPPEEQRAIVLQRELSDLLLQLDRNPSQRSSILASLQDLGQRAEGTSVSPEILKRISNIRRAEEQERRTRKQILRENVLQLAADENFDGARKLLETSEFAMDLEFRPFKNRLLQEVNTLEQTAQREFEEEQDDINRQLDELENELTPFLFEMKTTEALLLVNTFQLPADAAEDAQQRYTRISASVSDLHNIPRDILQSFQTQLGQELTIDLKQGEQRVRILEIEPRAMRVQRVLRDQHLRVVGLSEYRVEFSDLSSREILRRSDGESSHRNMLFKGILAKQAGSINAAAHYLRAAGAPFGPQMAAQLELTRRPLGLPSVDLIPEPAIPDLPSEE